MLSDRGWRFYNQFSDAITSVIAEESPSARRPATDGAESAEGALGT